MPGGLSSSRWASSSIIPPQSWPRPPPPFAASAPRPAPNAPNMPCNDGPSPEQELSRFLKIVARLNWKLPFLKYGYHTATDREGKTQQDIEAQEIHFKIDFYEYYMLIERALVHLMGIYGISIYAQHGFHVNGNGNGNGNGLGSANANGYGHPNGGPNENLKAPMPHESIGQHRYHANVLTALDDPNNPLHETLGNPTVRKQLSRAKDLRNRWKYADNDLEPRRFMPAPLEAYNLEQILEIIFAAFDQAFFVAEEYVRQRGLGMDEGGPVSAYDWMTDSEDWDFMVDAMDWQAV
ncbi:Uu.00g132680.m01.CDS01 [Anthostomella pinea]|uniref:Uu.00g132680.m01.CDS01 n=1 Tax=Anthostomella pinea TaxID=933095 RepID=A0AAI8YMM4_9PEZI|nr:Uu.00g132680.m01.CDS01 [Anthostomella pinea]